MGLIPVALVLALGPGNDAPAKVVVLPPVFDGVAAKTIRDGVTDAMVGALTSAGFEVVSPAEVAKQVGMSQCDKPRCATMIGRELGARYVTMLEVSVDEKDFVFDARVIDVDTGTVAAESSEQCELCGAAEATELAGVQATSLQQKIRSLSLQAPWYRITTDPPGARVLVDGKDVGVTPLELNLEPGHHEVRFEISGYVSEPREVDAVAGIREDVTYAFPSDVAPPRSKTRPMMIAGATLLGVGVAAIASGAAFLAIDGNDYGPTCEGDGVDANGQCQNIWTTTIPGSVITAVGGAATIAGVALVVTAALRRRGARSPGASAGRARTRVAWTGTGLYLVRRF